jgi:hypothetical protein
MFDALERLRGKEATMIHTTLPDLLNALMDEARSEAELIASVVHLVNSGRVRLCGTLRGARFEGFGTLPLASPSHAA